MSERKKVVVTGASSGIGYATAQRFAREGWDVCVTARRESILRELVCTFPEGNHLVCPGDYSDPACADSIGKAIAANWQSLDALANVAGVYMAAKVVDSPLEEWRRPLDAMVNGAVYMTRMAVPWMTNGGRIIHCTSIHGDRAEVGSSAYATAKAAINQYCRGLALELAEQNILVNAVAPSILDTPPNRAAMPKADHAAWPKVEEVAATILFLASPDNGVTRGAIVPVYGKT